MVTVSRLVLLTESLSAKFSPGWTHHQFLLGTDSWIVFSCKLLAGCLQDTVGSPEWSWKRNPKVVIWHHLLRDSLLSLTCLHICDYWKIVYDFKGHIMFFCSTNRALLFIRFSLGLRKGLLWEWRWSSLKRLWKMRCSQLCNDWEVIGLWIVPYEKQIWVLF